MTTNRLSSRIHGVLDQLGPLFGLMLVWGLFAALEWESFANWRNMQTVLLQTAVVGVAALGATMIIISGGIDLSVGSLIALVSVVVAWVITRLGAAYPPALSYPNSVALLAAIAGVALATLCGLAIGLMVIGHIGRVVAALAIALGGYLAWGYGFGGWQAWTSLLVGVAVAAAAWWGDRRLNPPIVLSPFIVTLGMWGALRGIAKGLADNSAIYIPPKFHSFLAVLMKPPGVGDDASALGRIWGIWPPGVWIFLIFAVLVALVLRYTQFGRHVYAIGSNEQTARLCGINVEQTKLKIYMIALALAGVAGVLQFSFNTIGDPNTAVGYELQVIAAVVIGGASLSGGVGGVLGTLAGALMMTIIANGCIKVGLENWMQEILTGGIIVAAVALDKLRHRTTT
jgi:ribose/xylose/arabinose/galactoside ABC-type transport system permease subunit